MGSKNLIKASKTGSITSTSQTISSTISLSTGRRQIYAGESQVRVSVRPPWLIVEQQRIAITFPAQYPLARLE